MKDFCPSCHEEVDYAGLCGNQHCEHYKFKNVFPVGLEDNLQRKLNAINKFEARSRKAKFRAKYGASLLLICLLLVGCVTKRPTRLAIIPAPPKNVLSWKWNYTEPMPAQDITFVFLHTYELNPSGLESFTYLTNVDQSPVELDKSWPHEFYVMYASNRVTGEIAWERKQ